MLNKLVIVRPKNSDWSLLEDVLPEDGLKQGMYTEMSSGNIRLVRSDGERLTIAGDYGAITQDLEEFIEPLFKECTGLLYLDEHRLMIPVFSPRFNELVHACLKSTNPFIITVSEESSFLDAIREYPKVMVWHISPYLHGLLEERVKEWVHKVMD